MQGKVHGYIYFWFVLLISKSSIEIELIIVSFICWLSMDGTGSGLFNICFCLACHPPPPLLINNQRCCLQLKCVWLTRPIYMGWATQHHKVTSWKLGLYLSSNQQPELTWTNNNCVNAWNAVFGKFFHSLIRLIYISSRDSMYTLLVSNVFSSKHV